MKIGVYGIEGEGILKNFAEGLLAQGHDVRWRRHDVFTADQAEPFDIVVTNGLRKHYETIKNVYQEKGIPVLVTDLGYIRKDFKYYQAGFNILGWVPEFECSTDRFKALDIPYPGNKSNEKGQVVILGQMPDDAAHKLDKAKLQAFYQDIVTQIAEAFPKNKIVFRPHPMAKDLIVSGVEFSTEEDLAKDLDGAFLAVTLNSTAGLEALIAGIPVLVQPGCFYLGLGSTLVDSIRFPGKEEYESFFSRLAYAQWTLTEITEGKAAKFLVDALRGLAPEKPVEAPVAQDQFTVEKAKKPEKPVKAKTVQAKTAKETEKEVPAEAAPLDETPVEEKENGETSSIQPDSE